MKKEISQQGLSQIIEQSDREELDNARHLLARLSNQEYLSQYVQLNSFTQIQKQFNQLITAPHNPHYRKFIFDPDRDQKNTVRQLRQGITKIDRAQKGVLSPQKLKEIATKKLKESTSRQVLSTSRRQKRDMYLSMLKTSRKQFDTERLDKSNSHLLSVLQVQSDIRMSKQSTERKNIEPPKQLKKDESVSQTVEDMFMRMEAAGEERDHIKRQWYSWGQSTSKQDKKIMVLNWKKTHSFMQQLLEDIMEKLTDEIGSPEVFRRLRIENTSLLSKQSKSKLQQSLNSTVISTPSAQQTRQIVRFNKWFNKLLLDERSHSLKQESYNSSQASYEIQNNQERMIIEKYDNYFDDAKQYMI